MNCCCVNRFIESIKISLIRFCFNNMCIVPINNCYQSICHMSTNKANLSKSAHFPLSTIFKLHISWYQEQFVITLLHEYGLTSDKFMKYIVRKGLRKKSLANIVTACRTDEGCDKNKKKFVNVSTTLFIVNVLMYWTMKAISDYI